MLFRQKLNILNVPLNKSYNDKNDSEERKTIIKLQITIFKDSILNIPKSKLVGSFTNGKSNWLQKSNKIMTIATLKTNNILFSNSWSKFDKRV